MNKSVNPLIQSLILRAQKLAENYGELLNTSTRLLVESKNIDQKLFDCCGVKEDQLLKNLIKYCNNEERVNQLLENVELKQTVEEYKLGVELIREKYKNHCESDILLQRYNLRSKYIAGLQHEVDRLDKRIDEMVLVMTSIAGIQDQSSSENQHTIQQLAKENQLMREQLQISSGAKHRFQQGLPPSSESSTQYHPDHLLNLSNSSDSDVSSFLTCVSSGCESWQSATNSMISELDVNNFIKEALEDKMP